MIFASSLAPPVAMEETPSIFTCIICKKTLEELKKSPTDIPITHTNFGSKGDAHELCAKCWNRERLKFRYQPKSRKKKFVCANCGLNEKQLDELASIARYYSERRRLPGDSRYSPAKYCGYCYKKLRKQHKLTA